MTGCRRQRMRGAALLALSALLAACGGSSRSSNPNSNSYDPAHTTLKDAGLEVCSETQTLIPYDPTSKSGLHATRSFAVAKDCKGSKTSPDVVSVSQFDSKQAVDAGYTTIKAKMPNAATEKYGPLVIIATGPNREAYLASIDQALKATGAGTTTT